MLRAKLFYGGQVREWDGEVVEVTSPIIDRSNGQRIAIGRMAQMSQEEGLKAHDEASKAWNFGMGAWPQMSQKDRIDCILRYVEAVIKKRDAIVHTLMWEICKTQPDAEAEFDRTMVFIEATIEALKDMDQKEGGYRVISGTMARVRRAAIGITLLLGAFNYPVKTKPTMHFAFISYYAYNNAMLFVVQRDIHCTDPCATHGQCSHHEDPSLRRSRTCLDDGSLCRNFAARCCQFHCRFFSRRGTTNHATWQY